MPVGIIVERATLRLDFSSCQVSGQTVVERSRTAGLLSKDDHCGGGGTSVYSFLILNDFSLPIIHNLFIAGNFPMTWKHGNSFCICGENLSLLPDLALRCGALRYSTHSEVMARDRPLKPKTEPNHVETSTSTFLDYCSPQAFPVRSELK